MSQFDALDERLRTVERALTDGDDDLTDLRDAADLTREVETLSGRLDELEARVDELDAATQAVRGYVGNVRAVNQSVEQTADAALAKAEALESGERPDDSADAGERVTEGTGANGTGPHGGGTNRGGRPCRCRVRRCERDGVSSDWRDASTSERNTDTGFDREGDAETDHDEPGLLARLARAL